MLSRTTFGTFTLDKTIRQKQVFDRIIQLFDCTHSNQPRFFQFPVNILGIVTCLVGVRTVVLIESNMKTGKIAQMFRVNTGNQRFRRNPFLFRTQHDGCAMGIIRTNIMDGMPLHFLETHPDIGLDILDQMSEMDAAIGIRQCGSYQDIACSHQLSIEYRKKELYNKPAGAIFANINSF